MVSAIIRGGNMPGDNDINTIFGTGEGETLPEFVEGEGFKTAESSQGERTGTTENSPEIFSELPELPSQGDNQPGFREGNEKKHPGRQFSSTYQPQNAGRKKNVIKHLIGEYDLSSADVNALHAKLLSLNVEELKQLIANPQSSVIEIAFASGIIKDMKKGRVEVVETMLNRSIGRPDLKIKGMFGYSREAEETIRKVFDEETADHQKAD